MMVLANDKVEKDGVKRLPGLIGGHFYSKAAVWENDIGQ